MSLRPASLLILCCASAVLAADVHADLARARTLQQSGRLLEARELYQQLLNARQADAATEGSARLELARIELAEGRYSAALAEGTKSVAIARSQADQNLEGNALTVTGLAHMYSGEYAASDTDLTAALHAARATHDLSAEITRLNNLGTVSYYQGRYADAIRRYRQALAIVESHPGESWNISRRQLTVANIATIYQRLGQYRNALATYNILRNSPIELPAAERAQMLTNMGALYRRLGDPMKALETYRAAQALYRGSAMQRGEITVLNNIGIAQALDLRALPEALRTFDEALLMSVHSAGKPLELQSRLYRGETLLRLDRIQDAEQDFAASSSLADALQAPEDKWKALYGLARVARLINHPDAARKLLREAVAIIETLRSNTGTTPRIGFLADKRQVYDLLIELQLQLPAVDVPDLFRLMEQCRARSLKEQKGAPAADIAAIRRALDSRTLFVEYWVGDHALAAVWVTQSGSGVYSRSGLKQLRTELTGLSDSLASNTPAPGDLLAQLSELLLRGFDQHLLAGAYRRMVIVPDRELSRLPFEMLWTNSGKTRLIELTSVSYLPTASFLKAPARKRGVVPFWNRMFLAVADPAPGSTGSTLDLALPQNSSRLPGAAVEAHVISAILDGRTEVHQGEDARKSYLENNAARPFRILHFATHAFIDPEDASRSYMLFAPSQSAQHYDYLFLKEVPALDLRAVDLVTASACETQAGEFVEGEGMENFSQAFLSSGARTVVTSLWKVGDRTTASLMRGFYSHMADGMEAAEALRQAKLQYLRSGRAADQQPFYWPAFVLNGDPYLQLPYVITWTMSVAVLLALAGGTLLLRWRRGGTAKPGLGNAQTR